MKKNSSLNVADLFAGVGGFRYGLEKSDKEFFKVVYSNQWEPLTKKQHAYECYVDNFGKLSNNENKDIHLVNNMLENDKNYISEKFDLVVGGFPCQDYSVATTNAQGIEGKKGILFWEIIRMIKIKNPKYVLLENVDRLLSSPGKKQLGRDFLIMIKAFAMNNYNIEWRIITGSEYGYTQRRKRVFIFAYKNDSAINKSMPSQIELNNINNTVLTKNFPIKFNGEIKSKNINNINIREISKNSLFNFQNYGIVNDGIIWTSKISSDYEGTHSSLKSILLPEDKIPDNLYLNKIEIERIFKLKDGGKKERISSNGFTYFYSEGKMRRFDNFNNVPARTMLTSEGTINRSTHIIKNNEKFRFLHPIEAERISGFPDNWTKIIEGKKRYFVMGNAVITNVITQIGNSIKYFEKHNQ